jgi:hypothetical protein
MNNIQTNNKYVPPIFVIQIQIPSEPPASFFSSSEDGPGWAVVMYFKITEVIGSISSFFLLFMYYFLLRMRVSN